ncbi:MAG: outer membrane protein assembly factor BamA [Desulfonatronovibrionaceae bacterium]
MRLTNILASAGISLFFALLAVVQTQPCLAAAEQNGAGVKMLVLPFEINAEQELEYLHTSLPNLLREELSRDGFETVSEEQTQDLIQSQGIETLDLGTTKDLAQLSGAKYAVYGSLSKVGETISIDARLVEASGLKVPKSLYVVKEGTVNILPAVQELTEQIKQELMQKERIAEIEVKGNKTLDKDVVLMRLKIRKGDLYDPKELNKELKRLYELGYFEDIQFSARDTKEGKKIIINVEEKPIIEAISVHGAEEKDNDDILEAMSTKTGSVLNTKIIGEDLGKIRELYHQDGYYNAQVDYELEGDDSGRARLNINIQEGEKLYIEEVRIKGVQELDEDDIKSELALTERGIFSWITGRGVLKQDFLERDAAFIEAYYANRGFVDARVGQPDVEFKEDGIYITFNVVEGDRYRVGEVDFSGELIFSREELFKRTKLDELAEAQDYFDQSVMRDDLQGLSDYYSNYGYAYAEADVETSKDQEDKEINVTYNLSKGPRVYIRRVMVEGNTKTRNNVILREMRLTDGELYDGKKINRSNVRLEKLDFFDSVDIETVPAEDESELDLKVKVDEKSTGMLSAGAGYSSLDKIFFTAQIQERNLFGKGYNVGLKGTFSSRNTNYDAHFWNPRLYDTKLGVGGDAYWKNREYFEYDKESIGSRARFSYPLGEYTKVYWNYKLEKYTISDVDDDADKDIKDMEGDNWASSAYTSVSRDTTNRRINPSKGTKNTLSLEYSGGLLGGDDNFIKTLYDTSYYRPLFWETVFHWHAKLGYLFKNADKEIPSFERFYLGGMNSVRGYPGDEIAPKYDNGDYKGGSKEFFTNFEYIFPLNQDMGILGVLFFDAGNTWDDDENPDLDLYKSVGAGIRWYSPLGPLRMEYGIALDELDGDKPRKFEFSVGQTF